MKKVKNKIVLLTLFSLGFQPAYAAQGSSKNDYAYGYEIAGTGNKSVIEFSIPEDAYLFTQSSSFTDFAVFNSKNERVPHQIRQEDGVTIATEIPSASLTLFPLTEEIATGSGFEGLHIETSANGAIIDIKGARDEQKTETTITGYLVDASPTDKPIEKFEVGFDDQQVNRLVKVRAEGSFDLKNWVMVADEAVLANFDINGERLVKNEIPLSATGYKYYRLSIRGGESSTKITSLKAHFSREDQLVATPLNFKAVLGASTQGSSDFTYQFDLGGFYPVSGLKIQFTDQNSVARLTILGSNDLNGGWQAVQSTTFYSVMKDDSVISKLETQFADKAFRYWRLRLDSNPAGIGSQFPQVFFGWRPGLVRFLARGEPPFTFTYGSGKAVESTLSEDLVSSDWSKDIARASLINKQVLGGPDALKAEKKVDHPWKKIALWVVLVFSVILLGVMAIQTKKSLASSSGGQ